MGALTGHHAERRPVRRGRRAPARLVVHVNPHNPLGRVFTAEEQLALAEVVEDAGARVFADEIHAPLVLPGAMWCEEEGTTTNLEGRVQRRRKAITAPGAAREDWRILCDLAGAVGRPQGFTYATFRDLQDEFFRATRGGRADYSGLSAERLDRASAQWPVPHATGPDTPYAYAPTYPTADGLAAVLRVPGGALWQFRARADALAIESSVWIDGDGRPVATQQLVVTGVAEAGGASVSWALKRAR